MAPKMNFTVTQWQLSDPTRFLYRALITAEIKADNNQPLGGRVSITAPEGEQIDINIAAKGTGTGELLFISRADAVILIGESSVQGQLLTARQQIVLKSKTSNLIPDRLSVNTAGAEGKYIFIVGVMDKNNAPVPDIPVKIINEKTRAVADSGITDQHGAFTSQEIGFLEKECPFLVTAGGLDPVELKLEGPSRWNKVELPPAVSSDTQHGFRHAIKTGWRRGRDAVTAAKGRTP